MPFNSPGASSCMKRRARFALSGATAKLFAYSHVFGLTTDVYGMVWYGMVWYGIVEFNVPLDTL